MYCKSSQHIYFELKQVSTMHYATQFISQHQLSLLKLVCAVGMIWNLRGNQGAPTHKHLWI